jgi:hypothetical protein
MYRLVQYQKIGIMTKEGEKEGSDNNSNNKLHSFEVDLIQRLLLRDLSKNKIQVDYGLPRYTLEKAKSEIALRQYKETFSNKEELRGKALRTLKQILNESIAVLDSIINDGNIPTNIRIKAKELRTDFAEELLNIFAAEKRSSDPYKAFNEATERRLWRRSAKKV